MLKNTYRSFLLLLAFNIIGGTLASATVSLFVQAENLRVDGSSNAPDGSLGLLVADTNNDGFGSFQAGNIGIDSFIDGSDDMVIGRFGAVVFSAGTTYIDRSLEAIPFRNGWDQGDRLALFWLPELTLGDTSVLPGDKYGLYAPQIGEEKDGSNQWVTPTDGTGNYTLKFFTEDAVRFGMGSNLPSAAFANLLVIPEPQTYALIFGGLTLLGLRIVRRRRVSVG